MTPTPVNNYRNILVYIRLLVLTVFSVAVIYLFLVDFRSSQHEKTVQTSLHHITSISHLQALQKELLIVKTRLILSFSRQEKFADTSQSLSVENKNSQSLYLIRQKHDLLVESYARHQQFQFASLMKQISVRLSRENLEILYTMNTMRKIQDYLPTINATLLKLEQLEKLHQISNSRLLEQGSRDDKITIRLFVTVLVLLLLATAIVVYRVLSGIKGILQKQQETELTLYQEKEWSHTTLRSIGDAVITTDETGRVEYMNPVAESLTCWSVSEARGQDFSKVFNVINEETGRPAAEIVRRVVREGAIAGLANHTVLISRDGRKRAIEDSAAPIRNKNDEISGVVVVFHDVTHSRKMAKKMSWQATHDALTGLANRYKFKAVLNELIESSVASDEQHAFLYIDLDQFKVVNDTCGHVAGDELLKQVSGLLTAEVRDVDTVARLGGDEFGILLASCPMTKAGDIANDVRQAVQAHRFIWEKKVFPIGLSIGLAPINASLSNVSDIMRAADMACYMAKDSGRNRVHVYQPGDQEITLREGEMEWVSVIRHALDDDRFLLYCQDIVPFAKDSEDGKSFEVLVRMQAEDGSVISPMSFIPAAERYHLMPAIDRTVVSKVFRKLDRNRHEEVNFVSINLSGQTLGDNDFLNFVEEQFNAFDLPPGKVCFEITETAAITNFPRAMDFITRLQARGCRFALDDFGSGLSSFGYLKNLPVDYLKIDGTFVRDMLTDPIDEAMIESINSIGHRMNIKTIAEFVENEEIEMRLREMGVDYGQGFGLSKPKPLAL